MSGFDSYASDPDPSARKQTGRVLEEKRTGATTITGPLAHTGSTAGFFASAPVGKPTALTAAAAAAPAGGAGAAAGAWDTAANRDIAIAAINSNRTRITELETKLRALGLLT